MRNRLYQYALEVIFLFMQLWQGINLTSGSLLLYLPPPRFLPPLPSAERAPASLSSH
jgi:hypothetical protein